jgi:hypothetical protein
VGRVVAFLRRAISHDWSAQELAEFYRVEAALLQSGLLVSSGRGVSDEGDPWFVFCREEDDEVIIHFARIGGRYLISASSYGEAVTGDDFQALMCGLLERQPVVRPRRQGDNITWHPSALLVVLVASALLKVNHAAEAAPARPADAVSAESDRAPLRVSLAAQEHAADLISQETQQNTAILSAIALVAGPLDGPTVPTMVVSTSEPAAPVHAPLLLAPSLDSDFDTHTAGAGSVSPAAPSFAASPLSLDAAVHAHNAASWQMQATPIAGGPTLPADQGAVAAVPVPLAGSVQSTPLIAGSPEGLVSHVDLTSSPHDLAGTLLGLLGGSESILYSATLPAVFITPMQGGVHIASADLSTGSHEIATSQISATAAALSPAMVSLPNNTAGVAAPAETTTMGSASGSDSGSSAFTPAAQSAAPLSSPSLTEVLANMQNFVASVGSHLAVLITGNQVIEYDYFAIDHTPAAVTAVTYNFADGSHLSLVGLPSELPHAAA